MRLSIRARLIWAILGVAVLAGTAWAARATAPGPSTAAGAQLAAVTAGPDGRTASAPGTGVASPLTPDPGWCCTAGNPLGVTVTGQATAHGAGHAARAAAIASAMTDAMGQANAVASAAGITLGRIINVQISAYYYPYPIPMGAASGAPGSPGGSGHVTGVTGSGATSGGASPPAGGGAPAIACPVTTQCLPYPGAGTSASVTVTWAIG
jgi:hypothetical protein